MKAIEQYFHVALFPMLDKVSGFHFLLCEKTQCVTTQTIVLVEMTKNDNLVNSHYQIERYPVGFCRSLPVERAVYSPADKD